MSQTTDVLETLWAFQRVVSDKSIPLSEKLIIVADLKYALPTERFCSQCAHTRSYVERRLTEWLIDPTVYQPDYREAGEASTEAVRPPQAAEAEEEQRSSGSRQTKGSRKPTR
jgi:hypothetical protein